MHGVLNEASQAGKKMATYFLRSVAGLFICCSIVACKPSDPEGSSSKNDKTLSYSFTLSQSEFDNLAPEDQFMVANKLLSTMYRGIPADQFFDLTQGLEEPVVQFDNFITTTQTALQTKMSNEEIVAVNQDIFGVNDDIETEEVDESIPARFTNIDNNEPHQIFMARNHTYPISKNQMEQWMSFFLANTIMFSPAREMDSTNTQDIDRVLGYLSTQLSNDASMRETVRGFLHNLSRWRVSRSPENHALEMFELYLGIFNDTPEEQQNTINGGIACSDWYLTDNDADYQLLKDNTRYGIAEPVKVFDQYIYDCDDLYDVVAGHPLLVPRMVEVISNYFLDGMEAAEKLEVVEAIVATNPETFQDVFLAVMYSKAFLLETTRPKTFEENAFNFLHAMHWVPRSDSGDLSRDVLDRLYDTSRNDNIGVHNMGWAAMDYKIGRTPFLPMDVQSFATYHKAMRESVLLNDGAYSGCYHLGRNADNNRYGCSNSRTEEELSEITSSIKWKLENGAFYIAGTENLKPELEDLTGEEFIDFVFLTAMGRRATTDEMSAFLEEGQRRNYLSINVDGVIAPTKTNGTDYWEYYSDDFAEIMLDYMSRLPEFYYYRAVQ